MDIYSHHHHRHHHHHHNANNSILNNRDRTHSESSSSTTTTSDHNRGRADTGDSSLSSDTNASINNNMGVRRRSHRPRGCRGGRKNRKKKNKVPAEIVGPNNPTAINIMSKESHGSHLGMYQPPFPSHSSSSDRNNAPNLASSVHFPPMNGGQPPSASFYHVNNHGVGECKHNVLSRPHPSQSMQHEQNFPPTPLPLGHNSTVMNTSSAYFNNKNNNNTDYTLESRPMNYVPYNQDNMSTRGTQSVATLAEILPPPPPVPTQEEKINRGPNPYALTKQPASVKGDMFSLSFSASLTMGSIEHVSGDENFANHPSILSSFHMAPTTKPMLHPVDFVLPGTSNNHNVGVANNTASFICESLFAISPRSFLTGSQGCNAFSSS